MYVQYVSSDVRQINTDLFDVQILIALFIEKVQQHISQAVGYSPFVNKQFKVVKFEYFAQWLHVFHKHQWSSSESIQRKQSTIMKLKG